MLLIEFEERHGFRVCSEFRRSGAAAEATKRCDVVTDEPLHVSLERGWFRIERPILAAADDWLLPPELGKIERRWLRLPVELDELKDDDCERLIVAF